MPNRNKLTDAAATVVAQELNRAFFRCGKRLMTYYMKQLSRAQTLEIVQNPKLLREIIEDILLEREQEAAAAGNPGPLVTLNAVRNYPTSKTRDRLSLLERHVREAPLDGLPFADAIKLINHHLGDRMTPESLGAMIRRNNDFHKLVVRNGHIRLSSDILVEILAQRHVAKKEARIARKRAKTPEAN